MPDLKIPNLVGQGNPSNFSNFTNTSFNTNIAPQPVGGLSSGMNNTFTSISPTRTSSVTPSKLGQQLKNTAGSDPGAFGQIAQGLAGIGGGIIGGGARRREQREARTELAEQRQAYEQFEFQDPTANMTNPFEDLTVNQQAAQFASQQQQQALAGTLSGLQGAAGSSGIGALAQAIAQQQQQGFQAAAADIGRQEQQNQLMRARGQQQLEQARSRGAQYVQESEFGRTEDLFNIAASRKAAADEARKQATEGLIGGVANLTVGAGRVAAAVATGGASEAVTGGLG